jgi:Sap, sulfolipid-1-addressing protein
LVSPLVGETTSRILLYALVAAASPIALVSTLAVLTSRRGRSNGIAFVAGFVLGEAAAFLAAFLVGSAATTDREENEGVAIALELAFGVALLAISWPQRRHPSPAVAGGGSRMKTLLERLRGLRPGTAFALGTLLGVGGVKRLSITVVAGATVGIAKLMPAEELALGALYVLVAGVLVWAPVAVYLVAGAHANDLMTRAEDWLTTNERRLTFLSTLVFGFLLTSDALLRLL